MASLREAQKEMTRRLILDAGVTLFVEKGYGPTTIDDIATAAGTTRVTFYAYFPSKSDLVRGLIADRLNEMLQRTRSDKHGSTAHQLVAAVADGSYEAIARWLRQIADGWSVVQPILRIGRAAAVVDPELQGLVDSWLEEAISDIEDGLNEANRVDPAVRHFRGVLAMAELNYVADNWGTGNWNIDHETMLDELAKSWTRLLGTP